MTISSLSKDRSLGKMAIGFLMGVLAIPATILLARPHADEVSDIAYFRAPREARLQLLNQVSASDRSDERVLVGSSIVQAGFDPPPGDTVSRFGLNGMRVNETTRIVRNLLNRSRPPKTIVVDWSALHDVPHEVLPKQDETLAFYSLDYLRFALAFRLRNSGEPERRGNATWSIPKRDVPFRDGDLEAQLAFYSRFAAHSRVGEFAEDLSAMCDGADTRFVIVRFPVYYHDNPTIIKAQAAGFGTLDYRDVLDPMPCDVSFVDLLAESLDDTIPQRAEQNDKSYWVNINHFRPSLGEILLDDPRLGGPGKLGRKETGQPR